MSMNTLIEFRNITKKFPGVTALNNVSLSLVRGEVHVLLGENGAGKSTLMKVLSGAITPDMGEVLLEGQPIINNSPIKAQDLGISMIYQELNLIPELSVMENIFLGSEEKGKSNFLLNKKRMYKKTVEHLSELNLKVDPRIPIKELGAGTQQMIEIAKAISKDSKVLVLDEPTSSLTDSEIVELFRIIKVLKNRGVGMFYISHRLEEISEVGDSVSILRDGEKISSNKISDLTMDEMIEQIAGRKITNLFPHTRKKRGQCVLDVKNCSGDGFTDINLQVFSGEIVGLSGLVGAGRTELARAIFGIDDYYHGEILVEGKKVVKKNTRKAVRQGIGLVPEDRKEQGLSLQKSIRENSVVSVLKKIHQKGFINVGREKKICHEYVRNLSIATPSIEKLTGFLSGGTQQKVVISKWLMAGLKLFIFDEPTRGIDVGAKSEIYSIMDGLVEQGAAILMISSDLPEILGMSDRVYVMSSGNIKGTMDIEDADQTKILQIAYSHKGGN